MMQQLRKMGRYLFPHKKIFLVGQIAMLVTTAAGLAFPWGVRGIFASLFENTEDNILIAVGLLAGIIAVREIANYGKNLALGTLGQNVIRSLRDNIYQKLLTLSASWFDDKGSGEIASRMSNDMAVVQHGLSTGLTQTIQQLVSLVAVIILLIRLDGTLTVAVFCILPIIMGISKYVGNRVRGVSSSTQESLGRLMDIINQSVAGMAIIKAFGLERLAAGLFENENERIHNYSCQNVRIGASAHCIIGLLNGMFLLVVIGLGAFRVNSGHLTPADLIAFILYSEMIAGPVSTLAGTYIEISKATAAFQRLSALLEATDKIQNPPDAQTPSTPEGHIAFENVSFSYDGEIGVLKNVELTVQPGETVALVGPSGGGKSTLAKLIPRFYDPTAGNVLIDGIPTTRMDLTFLRNQIALVPQETFLFNLSIADNIACGRPDASPEEIERAAQLANAHDFITAMPNGYQTEIGEGGARLSGGQRQRIAIARAFLRNPNILILDEATSALDTVSERIVRRAIDKLMANRTTLIIAHRLATIEKAHRVAVLKDGHIHAIGPHAELLQTCAFYRELYDNQFAESIPQAAQVAF